MSTTAPGRTQSGKDEAVGRKAGPLTFVLVGLAFLVLVGLGAWQLQRLAWKMDLLKHVAALQSAAPQPIGPVLGRLSAGKDVDFTRVETTCPTLEQTPTLRLYAVRDTGMAYRLITACPLQSGPYQTVLVDRGFVAREAVAQVRPGPSLGKTLVVGVLRRGDPPNVFAPRHTGSAPDWYARDVPAMAAALHAAHPAPTFLMLERPAPRGFGPTPAPLPAEIRNPHLGYALTWFGLAAALLGVSIAALFRRPAKA